jgi:hypothetical protein
MGKYIINEEKLRKTIRRIILEQSVDSIEGKDKEEQKPRCLTNNIIPLDHLVGKADEFENYSTGVTKRKSGVNSLVDTLGILNNLRLFKSITDGGSHLAYKMMDELNQYRNKNYYDETTGECHKAMDKVIDLYKENEHGTELVKDIERVLNLQIKDDELTPSPRAKEYLKQCINLAKGQ